MRDPVFAIDAPNAVDGDADAPCDVTRGESRFAENLDFVANQQRGHLRNLLPGPTASPHFDSFYHAFSPRLGGADFPERSAAEFREPSEIVAYYAKRFTTEENFRDTKDIRYGLCLLATHVGAPDRRDRLLFVCALSQALLTLLGATCECADLDQRLRANTSKKRTHSLFRQGTFWCSAIPIMRDEWFEDLMAAFEEIRREHASFTAIFANT